MGDRVVRLVDADDDEELRTWIWGIRQSFLSGRDIGDDWLVWVREHFDLDRCWTALDGGRVCGSARTFPSGLRLPGLAEVPVSCLSAVTVLPTHTRRGHVTRLMRTQLEAAVAAGEVASLLVAAEWPIYGRFGYGRTCSWEQWEIDTDRAVLRPDLPAPVGECALVAPEQFLGALRTVIHGQQETTPGSIRRPDDWLPSHAGVERNPGHDRKEGLARVVHHDGSGRPDGYAVYLPKERWDGMRPRGTVEVQDMAWLTPEAERELWRYLLTIDLVSTVTCEAPAGSAVRSLLVDGRAAHAAGAWDHIWAVVLDVPAAFSARAYLGAGEVTFEVVDRFLDRGGRFTLAADGSGAGTCVPAADGASPDLTLSLSDLSACWLGGTSPAELAVAGVVDEHRPGAVDDLARLLVWHQPPACFTNF